MPEFSLTKFLDPVFEHFASLSGIPVEQYTAIAGGEAIGTAEEAILDLVATGLLSKIIQCATGLGCTLAALYGKDLPRRLKQELIVWGQHSLTRVIDPKPSDILELRTNINMLAAGMKLGDISTITDAFLRTPEELKRMLAVLSGPAFALPPATPTPPPEAPPINALPAALVEKIYA